MPPAIPHTRTFADRVTPLICESMILELVAEGTLVRFMGGDLAARWHQDLTGAYLEQFLPPHEQARCRRHVETVCHYPVGLYARDEIPTSRGRHIEYEMIVLPLAVDSGKPPRCVMHRSNNKVLEFRETKSGSRWPATVTWIDIGRGIPASEAK